MLRIPPSWRTKTRNTSGNQRGGVGCPLFSTFRSSTDYCGHDRAPTSPQADFNRNVPCKSQAFDFSPADDYGATARADVERRMVDLCLEDLQSEEGARATSQSPPRTRLQLRTGTPKWGSCQATARNTQLALPFFDSPSEPYTSATLSVRVVVSRLRGRAVRRAPHDSMSLGRFRLCRSCQPVPPPFSSRSANLVPCGLLSGRALDGIFVGQTLDPIIHGCSQKTV